MARETFTKNKKTAKKPPVWVLCHSGGLLCRGIESKYYNHLLYHSSIAMARETFTKNKKTAKKHRNGREKSGSILREC